MAIRGKALNLSEEQKEQIKTMRAEGQTYGVIKEFFYNTYKISLYDPLITKIAGKQGHKPSAAAKVIAGMRKKGPRGHYKKRDRKKKIIDGDPGKAIEVIPSSQEAGNLIRQAYAIHKKDFLKIVEEAIKEK